MKSIFKLFVMFFALAMVTSCSTTKMTKDKLEVEKEKASTKDSIRIVERNRAIIDSLKIKIAQSKTNNPDFDKAVNDKLSEILSQLNTSKTSGDNSYGFVYDDVMKELRAYAKVGATENLTTINNATLHTKEITKERIEIPVKFIPKIVLIASIFGGCVAFGLIAFIIYKIVRLFYPSIKISK